MALTEQIDNADSQIAQLFNLDPYWVNAQKSSMTYSNVRDVNRQLYQTTLRYYLDPIEQRLNFPDIGFPGFDIRFSLDEFLPEYGEALSRHTDPPVAAGAPSAANGTSLSDTVEGARA